MSEYKEYVFAEGFVPQKLTEVWSKDDAFTYFKAYEMMDSIHVIERKALTDAEAKLLEVREQLRIEINGHEASQQEIKDLKADIKRIESAYINEIEIKELESKLAVAIEALEFYADGKNNKHFVKGGLTANEALKEIKGDR